MGGFLPPKLRPQAKAELTIKNEKRSITIIKEDFFIRRLPQALQKDKFFVT